MHTGGTGRPTAPVLGKKPVMYEVHVGNEYEKHMSMEKEWEGWEGVRVGSVFISLLLMLNLCRAAVLRAIHRFAIFSGSTRNYSTLAHAPPSIATARRNAALPAFPFFGVFIELNFAG